MDTVPSVPQVPTVATPQKFPFWGQGRILLAGLFTILNNGFLLSGVASFCFDSCPEKYHIGLMWIETRFLVYVAPFPILAIFISYILYASFFYLVLTILYWFIWKPSETTLATNFDRKKMIRAFLIVLVSFDLTAGFIHPLGAGSFGWPFFRNDQLVNILLGERENDIVNAKKLTLKEPVNIQCTGFKCFPDAPYRGFDFAERSNIEATIKNITGKSYKIVSLSNGTLLQRVFIDTGGIRLQYEGPDYSKYVDVFETFGDPSSYNNLGAPGAYFDVWQRLGDQKPSSAPTIFMNTFMVVSNVPDSSGVYHSNSYVHDFALENGIAQALTAPYR